MIPPARSETPTVLRGFQILTVVAPVLFFAAASTVSSFSSRQPSKSGDGKLRTTQLSLIVVAAILSTAEAAIDLKRSDISRISNPDAVYALFLTLVYVILSLGLVDNTAIASFPHYGAWAILLVCQGTVFAICI